MRRVVQQLWGLLQGQANPKRLPLKPREKLQARLELLALEDRVLPSVSPLGTISGSVGGSLAGQTFNAPGAEVLLSGPGGTQTTTTDSSGLFVFRSLTPGTYTLTTVPGIDYIGGTTVSNVTVTAGGLAKESLGLGGLSPYGVSLREVTNVSTPIDIPSQFAGPTSDMNPTVAASIANMVLDSSNDTTTLDLASNFSDPNAASGSEVQFNIMDGTTPLTLDLNLDDKQAPQTVANFLDYVESGRYDNTIFHRLSSLTSSGGVFANTPENVLQGGGFDAGTFGSVANSNDPMLANESSPSLPNVANTIAMARLSGDNTATSQFFFNITDNSTSLERECRGGVRRLRDDCLRLGQPGGLHGTARRNTSESILPQRCLHQPAAGELHLRDANQQQFRDDHQRHGPEEP